MLRTALVLAVAIVGAAAVSPIEAGAQRARPAAAAQAPQKDGWWIRVNAQTVAPNLFWRFGTQGRLGTPINWTRGRNPEELDVPAAQRHAEAIDIAALSLPVDQLASFCVFFGDQGVALLEFMREKNVTIDRTMRAPECMP
jgi:hypothetical protein